MVAETVRIRGSLTLPDEAAADDVRALIELESDREDGVPEIARWLTVRGRTVQARGETRSSYAGWRALRRAAGEIAAYATGGQIELRHALAGRVTVPDRRPDDGWIEDFAAVLARIKLAFGGARFDDRQLRIHLERSAARVEVPLADPLRLSVMWSTAFAPSEPVLFVRNRFSEVAPRFVEGAVEHVARVLVCPEGGRPTRTPIRLDRGPLSALDPTSALLEPSPPRSAFACAYFLERGLAYELRRGSVEVTAADDDDPHLAALR